MSQQLWGVDLRVDTPSNVTSSVHLSSAVLVPSSGSGATATMFSDVTYLLQATQGNTKVVLASLSPARPNATLNHSLANVALSISVVGAQSATTTGYHVSVSGYTAEGAAAASAAPASNKRKPEQSVKAESKEQQKQKKQKVEAKQQEEDDEDEDEEDEKPATPVKPTKAAAATPKSAAASPAAAPKSPARLPVVTLKNGLKLQDTKIGTGKEATDRSAVSIRYRGSLASNGKVFDSNMPRGQPLRFKIGGGDVIAGFEQGTKGMKVGGTRTVVIPSQLGYGPRGAPPDIPGNAVLVFDLELVSVK